MQHDRINEVDTMHLMVKTFVYIVMPIPCITTIGLEPKFDTLKLCGPGKCTSSYKNYLTGQ